MKHRAPTRTEPYASEHQASVRHRPETPRSFAALSRWYRTEWEAALPTRMHTRGVEADSALGSPTLAPAVARRTGSIGKTDDPEAVVGWGMTGWDRDGNPIGVDADGNTTQPFLYHLERMLRSNRPRRSVGASALVRWAYLGWDVKATAIATFRRTHVDWGEVAMHALLAQALRELWNDCQTEPIRYTRCTRCKRGDCICADKSESQHRAEEAVPTAA